MDLVRKLILEKLEEKRMTMSEASLKIGRSHSYLQQFLKRGVPAELLEPERLKLAELLEVPESELRGPSAALQPREYFRNTTGGRESSIAQRHTSFIMSDAGQTTPNKITPGNELVGENDLPVFGTAQGGQGALIVTDRAVDWVVRPAPLLRVREGYGMIITGDSMSPKIDGGDTVLVNPHLPARSGDTCIFRCHDDDGTVHAIVKELRGEASDHWKVRQYNPKKDFTLKKSEWQVCHKIVGTYFG